MNTTDNISSQFLINCSTERKLTMKSLSLRLLVCGILLALLLTACYASQPPAPTAQPASQMDAANHAPVILRVEERTENQNGQVLLHKDIYFSDREGDATTVVHRLISTVPAGIYISRFDDVDITASADEQKLKGLVTSPVACPVVLYPFSLTIEARIRDATGNLSEPVIVNFACPANPPNSIPSLIIELVIGLGLLAGFWLSFRKRPSEGKPAILSILLLFCSWIPMGFLSSTFHEGGHALANLIYGGTVWSFYVHPFTFSGFVRPITDMNSVWTFALAYITNILVSLVIFLLFWKRRSASNLPFVMLFPWGAIIQGLQMLDLSGDTYNIMQITGLPAIVFLGLGFVLVCAGIFFLLSLFPLLGLAPGDRKSLLVVPVVLSLQSIFGMLVAHLFVPGSPADIRYLEGGMIINSANNVAFFLPIVGVLLAVIHITLFRKIYPKLPAWLRTETVNLTWKGLRLPALLAVISVILGLIVII
jgi:hypothetical protein